MQQTEQTNAAVEMDDLDGKFLVFDLDGKSYSVSLRLVLEIIKIQPITHLPYMPVYVKGIINLRGKVVPILDLRLKLGMAERAHDDKTCIIIVEVRGVQLGLIVDSVSEVIDAESGKTAVHEQSSAGESYLSSVSEVEGRIVLDIDCEKLLEGDLPQAD